MSTRWRLILFMLSLVSSFGARVESARAVSERLLITDIATGVVQFDGYIEEGSPERLSYVAGQGSAIGTSFVVLLEPAGEPSDTENPVFFPGTNSIVSDVVVMLRPESGDLRIVQLISDGDPNLADSLSAQGPYYLVEATGHLQDLTEILGSDLVGWKVEVQSDLVQDAVPPCVDSDADGEHDPTDQCPGTEPGATVDSAGCSLAEFCSPIDVTTGQGRQICRISDWNNDEPGNNPRDCTADRTLGLCVPATGTLQKGPQSVERRQTR